MSKRAGSRGVSYIGLEGVGGNADRVVLTPGNTFIRAEVHLKTASGSTYVCLIILLRCSHRRKYGFLSVLPLPSKNTFPSPQSHVCLPTITPLTIVDHKNETPKCVDEVVATATESRALSAFLACGSHRSPAVRAKSALAVLLCVRRRCYHPTSGLAPSPLSGAASSRRSGGRIDKRNGGGGGAGHAGSMGAREMDRLLSALPRFLQVSRTGYIHMTRRILSTIVTS